MAQLNMTNPTGYFVENLFTNKKLGLVGIHDVGHFATFPRKFVLFRRSHRL